MNLHTWSAFYLPANVEWTQPMMDDSFGDYICSIEPIRAEKAAEMAISAAQMSLKSDAYRVWVWEPGKAAEAAAYIVRIKVKSEFEVSAETSTPPTDVTNLSPTQL